MNFIQQNDDGIFHGFIRVLINLNRPVNVNSDTSDLTMRKALHRSNSRRISRRHQSVTAVNRAASMESQNTEGLERTSTMPAASLAPPIANDGELGDDLSKSQRVSLLLFLFNKSIYVS